MRSWFFLFTIFALSVGGSAQGKVYTISTEPELKADLERVPCKGAADRLAEVKKLFLDKGAAETDLKIEKIDGVENLVVTKTGKTAETVIVGAHYDKTDTGCGAIDNWTGIVVLANIYRTIRPLTTEKTYIFAAFDDEESGLVGSDEMARKIPKEKRGDYCAMVNFDSFGFSYPQVLRNVSSPLLTDLAAEVSAEMKIPFAKASISLAGSDSESFKKRDIPAVTLHGLSDQWSNYLHTPNDKIAGVNIKSLSIGYRHALVFVSKIENKPCSAFRKGK